MKWNGLTRRAALGFGVLWLCGALPAQAADGAATLPAVLTSGFAAWTRGGASQALDTWQKGGLLEGDRKVAVEVNYFSRVAPAIGAYKSADVLQAQTVSQFSQIIYLAMNFDRAVVYARFLLYHTAQDWVVQNMDFNVKPEVVIPWMALPASSAAD